MVKVLIKSLVGVVLLTVLHSVQPVAQAAPKPTVTSLSPKSGLQAGGTTVTISGSGFRAGATSVTFDGIQGTKVKVLSSTRLTVKSPSGTDVGKVNVQVKVGGLLSATSAKAKFKYLPMTEVVTTGAVTCRVTTQHVGSCWGRNEFGQVTLPTDNVAHLSPISQGSKWRSIRPQDSSVCGVKLNGTGWCRGLLFAAQGWVQVPGSWKVLQGSGYLGCGIKSDSTLWCWGENNEGQVGVGSEENYVEEPTQVGTGTWRSLSMTSDNVCAIDSEGKGYCWGDDALAAIGNAAAATNLREPGMLESTTDTWNQLKITWRTTCGIDGDEAFCWGKDEYGQVGTGATGTYQSPTSLGTGWRVVEPGLYFSCGIKTNGGAWCWGEDAVGQLGYLDPGNTLDNLVPQVLPAPDTWRSVTVGVNNACGILSDRTLWCWGYGLVGTTGTTTDNKYEPAQVPGKWWSVTIGNFTTCGVKLDNTVWCWGMNQYDVDNVIGAVGSGEPDNQLTPVKIANV